jgi:thioredoxin
MAANFKVIATDSAFQPELSSAGTKLVVVDFYATWCGPCQRVAPVFEQLATKYPKALFLKVDVDKCPDTGASQGVSALPTFVLLRNKTKLDMLRGADMGSLEDKVKKWYGGEGEGDDEEGASVVKGHMDLVTFYDKNGCECLNETNEHPLSAALSSKDGYLESDCDEQLLISIAFNQLIRLHSIRVTGPPDKAPKTVKLFINQPKTLDFDSAESMTSVQTLTLESDDVQNGSVIPLQYVKFQNVSSITLFVKDNQDGGETTRIDHLAFYGSPVGATNMADFKRIAGKKGESH